MDHWRRGGRGPAGDAGRGGGDDVVAGWSGCEGGDGIRRNADQHVCRRAGRAGGDPRVVGARERADPRCPHPTLPQRGRDCEAPMSAGLSLILVASAALFAIGTFALVARRSAVLMLLGTQFMFMASGIAFVAFARFGLGAGHATAGAAVAIFAGAT